MADFGSCLASFQEYSSTKLKSKDLKTLDDYKNNKLNTGKIFFFVKWFWVDYLIILKCQVAFGNQVGLCSDSIISSLKLL